MINDKAQLWSKHKPTVKEFIKEKDFIPAIGTAIIKIPKNIIYYHSEFVYDGIAYSADVNNGVRDIPISELNSSEYDIIPILSADIDFALNFFKSIDGLPYDKRGIFFSQMLPLNTENPLAWFCSESVAAATKIRNPHSYNPTLLHFAIQDRNDLILIERNRQCLMSY